MLPQTWTSSQRRVLIGIVAVLLIYLSIQTYRHRAYVSDPQPVVPSKFSELADKLDPNIATEHELAALPGLGEKRAAAIVAYREKFLIDHPGERAFNEPADLTRVKGIGPAMLANLQPFLNYPADAIPATQP